MKLNELYDFITENTAIRKYSCLMVDFQFLYPEFEKLQNQILSDDVYLDASQGYGLEEEPHVTVKYGLHESQFSKIKSVVDFPELTVKFGNLSLFENEEFDVLKFGIISKSLRDVNRQVCENCKFTDKFPVYKPHSTVGYLKPGTGRKYLRTPNNLTNQTFVANKYIFSNAQGDKVYYKVT